MAINKDYYSSENLIRSGGTGDHGQIEESHTIVYPIGKYEVTVRLSPDGHFLSVDEVKVNKTFIDYQKLSTSGDCHDVDEFYKE
jgi:hypothetical protein